MPVQNDYKMVLILGLCPCAPILLQCKQLQSIGESSSLPCLPYLSHELIKILIKKTLSSSKLYVCQGHVYREQQIVWSLISVEALLELEHYILSIIY